MPDRYHQTRQQLLADRAAVTEAAELVRHLHQADRPPAGLDRVETTTALAGLLDAFAENLHLLPNACRAHLLRVTNDLRGHRMEQPTTRRTRRRR